MAGFSLKIAHKLPLAVVGAALVASAIIGLGAYFISAGTVMALTEDKLRVVAAQRAEQLEDLLQSTRSDLLVTAASGGTVWAIQNLVIGWPQVGDDPSAVLKDAFITNNPNADNERELLDQAKLNKGMTFDMAHGRLNPGFRGQLQAHGYEDIYLFDVDGYLIYSVKKQDDFASSFTAGAGAYADSPLGIAYREALAMSEPGKVVFTDAAPYVVTPEEPASFMAAPVFNGKTILGVVAFKMPIKAIGKMMESKLGLGETGETFFVGTDHQLRSDSRFSDANDVLKTSYRTEDLDRALGSGESSFGRSTDYRGLALMTATVPVSFEGVKWALVSAIGEDEAFALLTSMRNSILLAGALVLAFAILFGLVVSRTITRPISRLNHTMDRLANGDLTVEVSGKTRRDEIGAMARSVEVFRESALKITSMTEEERAASERRRDERIEMMQNLQRAFGAVVDAAGSGDFSRRVDANFPDAELNQLARSVNNLVETVDRGLNETGAVLSALAQTDLTVRMQGDYEGAFGQLRDDTNGVGETLTGVVRGLRAASRALKVATGEMLSGSNDLSQRTTKQSATIEETAAAMDQLASTVHDNARRAEAASLKARAVSQTATDGGAVMHRATEAMERIINSSGKISNIIGVIDDIAFQTNLLALNASVEAARAGEAGRGFAVVAVEVRRLAQSAAQASSEVKVLVQQSGAEVSGGTKLVAEAAQKLVSMLDAARESSSLIEGIAQASKEQAEAIEEVSEAVRTLDEMTQHNAALVEETNAAIEQTEAQATELDRIVDVFTVDADGDDLVRTHRAA